MGHNTVWQFESVGKRDVSTRRPALRGAALYGVQIYRSGAGHESALIRFDADGGQRRWEFRVPHAISQPLIGPDGVVYVSGFDGAVYAVGAEGRQHWRSVLSNRNLGAPVLLDNGQIVVAEVGTGASRTYGIDRRSGEQCWQVESAGHVYGMARSGARIVQTAVSPMNVGVTLRCIDVGGPEKVKTAWLQHSDEFLFRPLIDGDRIYVGARHSVHIYDLASGDLLGQFALSGGAAVNGELLCDNGRLYFGDDKGVLRALNVYDPAQLALMWDFAADSPIGAQPILFDDEVFFVSRKGTLYGLNPDTGRERSRLPLKTDDDIGGLCATSTSLYAAHGRALVCFDPLLQPASAYSSVFSVA
jgi:outer membrane protein assembly factor BamB